ncbi:MAG: DUF4835 family protein [Bacteroidales bacterium]
MRVFCKILIHTAFTIVFLVFFVGRGFAQEIRCNVSVTGTEAIRNVGSDFFKSMQKDISDFVNNRIWTGDNFQTNERIDCSIYIILEQQSGSDEFSGNIRIQSRRPVFNSTYQSTLLNINDANFSAKYVQNTTLEYEENGSSRDNLANIIAFYVYMILGYDYDSFSLKGGSEFYQKAQAVVNNAQSFGRPGWSSSDRKGRYWFVENLTNGTYGDFRECLYEYHRLGLDVMESKPDEARTHITKSLENIEKVFKARPGLYCMQVFFSTKAEELVSIYEKSTVEQQQKAYKILSECDPANARKYDKILNNSTSY